MKSTKTNWPEVAVEDFTEVITGGTPSTTKSEYWKGGNIPWLNSGELNKRVILQADNFITQDGLKNSAAKMMPPDTVLVALTGATTGVSALLKTSACGNQSVTGILPSKRHHPHFLFHYIQSIRPRIVADSYGGAQKHISQAYVKKIKIPLPPVDEQARIANLLDEADELRKLRAQADRHTDTLIPALFHEMFGDSISNPKDWPRHKLPELCEGKEGIKAGPFGSSLKKDCYTSEGPRVYGQEQVIGGDFSIGDYHISEAKFSEMSAYVVKSGDLLISLVGTIGKVIVVPDGIERGIINPRLLRVRPRRDLLHPCYLAHVLTSPSVVQFLGGIATGITMGVLNGGMLKKLNIPLPPIALQKEFAQRVTEIRELEASQATSRTRLDALFQSMLHRAFNGEL
jgi:type I restriction enzyme S subunit